MERRQGRARALIEQQSLLGGVDLVAPGRGPGRTVHVDPRWTVGFAAALALVVEHGKKAGDRADMPARARCPRCHRTGDTLRDFGVRTVRGRRLPQSWCRDCRASQPPRRPPSQTELLTPAA
ncbi:MAG TPA: hypothetical protein VEJ89_10870 [Myxococcaceae bacterium]|jgi:hypothetical protein|nr:hypothetical protein [Myxococcaceae bacterium]